jgi:phosphatidate cytidylyltransferase
MLLIEMSGEGMFKARILTSIGLISVVFGLTYLASNLVVVAVFTGVLFLSGLEWAAMVGLQLFRTRLAFAVLLCFLSCFGIYGLSSEFGSAIQYWLGVYCVLFWGSISVWICSYQKKGAPALKNQLLLCSLGVLVLLPFFLSIVLIWRSGPIDFLTLILVVSAVDVFAFWGGRKWGKSQFVSLISPGKTWAGVQFGFLGAFVVGNLLYFSFEEFLSLKFFLYWNLTLICTIFAAILGDLLESLVKRFGNIKNSGVILPGHGGVLDRIDSLCAAAPVFLFFNYIFLGS